MLPEPLRIVKQLAEVFDNLNIAYLVGGSIASSLHGIARSTLDVDFVADVKHEQVTGIVTALEGSFYVDDDMIRQAISTRSSFNVIHLATMVKADVFLRQFTPWAESEWARRRQERIGLEDEGDSVQVASAEDMILQKLEWYRMGGSISDRQWGDIQGMLKVQAGALDHGYLQLWAAELGLEDLLDAARTDAGLANPGSDGQTR